VLCNYQIDSARTPCILFDHVSSIYLTTRYLLDLGHRRIALLNLAAPYYYPARMRRQGFENAYADLGLRPARSLLIELQQPTHDNDDWREAINSLLDRAEPPTAIVAFNDEVALQVYTVCRARGLQIPRDLSVTGCDDILSAQYVHPPLTSVRVPAYEQGRLAMQLLVRTLAGDPPAAPQRTLLEVELIVRESCAPLE
jgi:DNA-binding LacI/PurR family transcriptional regulator